MTTKTLREAVREAVDEEMQLNAAVIVLGENPADWDPAFSERVINLPYGENLLTTTALGLAMTGAKPVVYLPGEYLLRSADVLANEIAVTDAMYNSQYDSSVVVVAPVGNAPHHGPQLSQSYEAVFTQFPNIAVVYPSNASDAKILMKVALSHTRPVIFLESRQFLDEPVEMKNESFGLGKASVVHEGRDVTIVTYGPMVSVCLKAATLAAESGLFAEVIDLRTIRPLDMDTIAESIKKTGKLILVHESRRFAGIGAEISAQIAESDTLFYLESKIIRICGNDDPVFYSRREYGKQIPNEEDILRAIILLSTGE